MEFLKYSNEHHCNIMTQQEFESLVHEVFDVVSTNVSRSLGPLGSWATILEGNQTEATKDGFEILKSYRFHNRYKRLVFNLIKQGCTNMNNIVGDGTTTVNALANALFNQYKIYKSQLFTLYRLPREFTHAWDSIISTIVERVQARATSIDPTDYDAIYNLAYVTSNGSDEISRNVANAYRESIAPTIVQKDSPTNKSYIELINGISFPADLLSEVFVRNEDLSVTEEDICVMIFNFKIETDFFNTVIVPINKVLRAMNKKLLIIAPFYDSVMLDTYAEQHVRMEANQFGSINLIMAQYRSGKLQPHQLEDLAVVLGCKKITQDLSNALAEEVKDGSTDKIVEDILENPEYKFTRFIGHATSATLTCTNGSVFKVDGIENDAIYKETVMRAKQELQAIKDSTSAERLSYASKIYEAQKRVNQLEMKSYVYYIGADSNLQKNITWASIEDVIKCLRSATKYGVVPGCQLTIAQVCNEMLDELESGYPKTDDGVVDLSGATNQVCLEYTIITMIYNAVLDVYSKVLSGPDMTGILKTVPRWQYTTEEGKDALMKEVKEKTAKIISESIERQQVFDLETLDYSDKVITSVQTDTLALTTASDLVKVLISGNQCIFLDTEINSCHQEDVESYVSANQHN